MRPKKTILVFTPCETIGSVIAFQTHIWGYSTAVVNHRAEVIPKLVTNHFDLVLLMPSPDTKTWNAFGDTALDALAMQAKRYAEARIYDPANILGHATEVGMGVPRILNMRNATDHLRESIRITMERRRGPKTRMAA